MSGDAVTGSWCIFSYPEEATCTYNGCHAPATNISLLHQPEHNGMYLDLRCKEHSNGLVIVSMKERKAQIRSKEERAEENGDTK